MTGGQSARLIVRVLGGLVVEGVSEHQVGSRKGRQLLKVLALARGAPVTTDRLVDILWGDDLPARPAEQVGVLVSRLRGVLGAERLPRTDAGYALRADWLDIAELEGRVAEAAAALDAGRLGAARTASVAALALVRGEVLPDEEGEWVEADRAAAAALTASARRIGAEAAARGGDHSAAAALAEQALAHDACDEASLRILMRCHLAAGRAAAALAAYGRVRERLAEDLGVSPMPETEALHEEILLGSASTTSVSADPSSPDPAGSPPRANAGVVGDGALLVGRAAELAILSEALAEVVGGGGSKVVVVEGEAGIGKTTLVEAWRRSVGDRAVVLSGRCDELGRDLPLQPVADAVAGHIATLPVAEQLEALGPDAEVLRPVLVVGAVPAGANHLTADPETGRAQLFAALVSLVARLSAGRPVVLTVDDLHLDPGPTSAWIAFAARRLPALLAVLATRPGPAAHIHADVVIRPPLLGRDDIAELVGADRAADLHHRSGGLPLLLAALASDESTGAVSLAEVTARRVAGLGAAAETIRTAAVLGARVDLDLLAAVLQQPARDLLGHLDAAALSGVLVEEEGFRFRHELEREALQLSAGRARQALVHRDAARALAARSPVDPLAAAVHARLGGDTDLAIRWFVAAARASEARFDVASAEEHLAAALALAESAAALALRARIRIALGRLDDAEDDARRAIAAGGGAPALEVGGWVAYYQRRYDVAVARADEALARAPDDDVRASCLALAGRILHGAGSVVEAEARLEEAVLIDAAPAARGLASVWLAHLRVHEGRPAEALRLADRALVDPGAIIHPFAPLHGRFARAMALGHLGRVADALTACDDLSEAARRAGPAGDRFRGPVANARGWLLRWTGDNDAADEHNSHAVEISTADAARAEAYYAGLLDLLDGRLLVGDLDGAATTLGRLASIERWNGTMAWHQRHRWQLAVARLAMASGDPSAAHRNADAVEGDARARGALRYAAIGGALRAIAAADPSVDAAPLDASEVADIVAALTRTAGLDGWPLIAALADRYQVAAWRSDAERLAAAVAAGAPNRKWAEALGRRLLR